MFGELTPCGGGDAIPLLKEKLLVGRRTSCDVTLRFPNVSSHHCELKIVNGYWFVRDLGSRNGIKVNGESCETKCLLPGDVLFVAKHRYEIAYTPPRDAAPPEEEDPLARGLLEKAGLEREMADRIRRERNAERQLAKQRSGQKAQQEERLTSEEEKIAMRYLREMGGY
ncbi:MAG: FHA domain-containing protein [Planctomycetota bacterium]|nr:FHA domain-containing protein [Planctomycetota bacterium]